MHIDPWSTLEGRHLVYAYAGVILIQGGYLLWIAEDWLNLSHADPENSAAQKSNEVSVA